MKNNSILIKKSLIKKLTCSIVTLSIALFFLASCSPDDEKDPAVVFTSLEANKTDVFIEEKIILNLVGTGFTDAELGCSNPSVKITKVTSTIYEISSDLAATANVFVTLSNKTNTESKNIFLNFHEHGIKDFNTVEGIRVNIDKSSKVLNLLGDPENKSTSTTNTNIEFWSYPSKGLLFGILKSSNLVDNINAYSSNFSNTLENGTKVYYKNYPFDIGNGWYINNTNTIMDAVITKLGQPTNKYSSTTDPTSTYRTYRFATQNMYLGFFGSTEDDYIGKTIISIILY